tara:strand:+ start:563 stop:1096 length:534 start_codon:yes stop_codon:yes gene_type:complete
LILWLSIFVAVARGFTRLRAGVAASIVVRIDDLKSIETTNLNQATTIVGSRLLTRSTLTCVRTSITRRIDLSGSLGAIGDRFTTEVGRRAGSHKASNIHTVALTLTVLIFLTLAPFFVACARVMASVSVGIHGLFISVAADRGQARTFISWFDECTASTLAPIHTSILVTVDSFGCV